MHAHRGGKKKVKPLRQDMCYLTNLTDSGHAKCGVLESVDTRAGGLC